MYLDLDWVDWKGSNNLDWGEDDIDDDRGMDDYCMYLNNIAAYIDNRDCVGDYENDGYGDEDYKDRDVYESS